MTRIAIRVALLSLASLAFASSSARAAHPPTPDPGCQFAGGITSCSSTAISSELAPLQFGQGTTGQTTDGTGAALLCAQQGASSYQLDTIFVAVLVTTTTTTITSHRGSPASVGQQLPTQTTATTVASIFAGQVSCF